MNEPSGSIYAPEYLDLMEEWLVQVKYLVPAAE